ncbi:MAG: hypothetical protein J6U23_11140 [Clostridiales bacterium]|nr:hypothetical protein [Clostridiales bacterium]
MSHQYTIFDEDDELNLGAPVEAPEDIQNAWRKAKQHLKQNFTVLQEMDYEAKLYRQDGIAHSFLIECQKMGKNCHVSVGGLDSIVLYIWLKSIGIDVPGITVSSLEDKGNQRVHKALGLEMVKSYKTKTQVLQECGFPVISKRIAGKINLLQNPTEQNKTVRHAIITGECGAQGHFAKNSRMQLPDKWLKLFGGYENENEGVGYRKPDFKVSNDCCYWLKEKPCDDWAKEHNSYPYLGLMASEGGQREEALIEHGCNYYGRGTVRSAPFAIFMRNDILRLALEMDKWYHDHLDIFEELYYKQPYSEGTKYEPVESIIPTAYGEIKQKENGDYYTTRAQRTGCSMCGFGIHLEERPHRFDILREDNPKEWDFYMNKCCTDENGNKYGWGKVLDYIGVGWRDVPAKQITIDEYLKGIT